MNPIIELANKVRENYDAPINTVFYKKDKLIYSVDIVLPNGKIFTGTGASQREARIYASNIALIYVNKNYGL